MNLDEYQHSALETWDGKPGLAYLSLGLAGEAGEFANKYKKVLRGDSIASSQDMADELGDVLWYLSVALWELGYSLEDIALRNLSKLKSRKKRGLIKGKGDHR